MTQDIEEIKEKLSKKESEFTNDKNRLQTELSKLKDLNMKIEVENRSLLEKNKNLEGQHNTTVIDNTSLKEEKKSFELQINKLNTEISKNLFCII